jgi:hypothetical protein
MKIQKPKFMHYLIALSILFTISCSLFEVESQGQISNGKYKTKFDTVVNGNYKVKSESFEFSYSHFTRKTEKIFWSGNKDEKGFPFERVLEIEKGSYTVIENKIIYTGLSSGTKFYFSNKDDSGNIFRPSFKDVIINHFPKDIYSQPDSIIIQDDDIWILNYDSQFDDYPALREYKKVTLDS